MIPTDQQQPCEFVWILDYIVYFLIIGVSGLFGWVLSSWKTASEIRKLKAETDKLKVESIKLAGDNLLRLQNADLAYNEAMSVCSKSGSELVMFVNKKASVDSICSMRERFCSAFSEQVIPKYRYYVEWEIMDRKSNPEQIVFFVREQIIPEMERFREFLDIINLPSFTEKMGLQPLQIQKRTMEPFLKINTYFSKTEDDGIRTLLENAIKRVVEG